MVPLKRYVNHYSNIESFTHLISRTQYKISEIYLYDVMSTLVKWSIPIITLRTLNVERYENQRILYIYSLLSMFEYYKQLWTIEAQYNDEYYVLLK